MSASTSTSTSTSTCSKPLRIIRRAKAKPGSDSRSDSLPPHISDNSHLRHVISSTLPADYDFEIPKTIDRIEKLGAVHVALQLPEGLLMYATAIGDILVKFAEPARHISVLGDVTYGACCIDDLTALSLGADLLVHYGHSCLVPTTVTRLPCLYVFVEIRVDVQHLVDCVSLTFENECECNDARDENADDAVRVVELAVMGTVQFRSAVVEAANKFNHITPSRHHRNRIQILYQAIVPQAKPLSPGEVLGCTAPSGLADLLWSEAMKSTRERRKTDRATSANTTLAGHRGGVPTNTERVMIFLADGRFHLEAAMISNPSLRALRYDPYSKTLTEEKYLIAKMKTLRRQAVQRVRQLLAADIPTSASSPTHFRVDNASSHACAAAQTCQDIADSLLLQPQNQSSFAYSTLTSQPKTIGIVLGTLGRQGNPGILARIRSLLHSRGVRTIIVLLSEIFPKKLEMLSGKGGARAGGGGVCAWVQIACPRLSIDWGHYFCVPVLTPFELFVALGEVADSTLWSAHDTKSDNAENSNDEGGYPMDFYSKAGGPWTNYFDSNKDRKVVSYGV